MLTDQTNIGFDLEPPMLTPVAVQRFLERLGTLPATPNFLELELA
jgi:hypothetical protein